MRVLVLLCAILLAAPASANVARGVEKWRAGDWNGAVAEWTGPAARGDADALFNMGQAYRLGRGVRRNNDTAIDFYRRAAAKGHVSATASLGITLWQEGRRTEALTHLRDAADKGDLRAAYVLGVATFSGDGAPRNPELGYAYMLRARDGGLEPASGQAARMATRLTEEERARGSAAAAALAAGRPVAVALAQASGAQASRPEASGASAPESRQPARAAASESQAVAASDDASADGRVETARAEPAAAATDAAAIPGWKVQLGAYATERAARTAWAALVSQSAGLLKGQKPIYSPRSGLVRLQVGPFPGRDDASRLCASLSAAGRPCFVTSR